MARAIAYLLLAAACSLLPGCTDRGDFIEAPPPNPDGITFAADIQPIFNARCAISGCHVLPTPQAGLVLSAGCYTNLVNVPTQIFTPGVRVTPYDLSASVLYLLVSSGTMPATGGRLTTAQINAIGAWIESGAPNN